MKIKDIQLQLAARGYTPGPIDGIWGRRTIAAVRQFQTNNDLEPDGIVGPLTLAELFEDHAAAGRIAAALSGLNDPTLVWLQEARRLLGTKEEPGTGNNRTILDFASKLGLKAYDADSIPWCGLFVGHCINSTLDREPTPSDLLSARSWERFGIRCEPTPGAVLVFWRGTREGWQGHVGLYVGQDATGYRVLGGNQSDSVCLAWLPKERLLTARWPSTVPPRATETVVVARTTRLSWNEA